MTHRILIYFQRLAAFSIFATLLLTSLWACAPMENTVGQQSALSPTPGTYQKATADAPEAEVQLSDATLELTLEETLSSEDSDSELHADALEEITIPEPDETVVQEVEDLEKLGSWDAETITAIVTEEKKVEYDFPITINRQVEYYLDFFQNRNKKSFEKWLIRSGRYLPLIQKQLKEAGLPTDLAYLPMIESGYSLTAYSKARAVGPWQFMRETAIDFGLKVTSYVDERRDPVKSTAAAIAYLKRLYTEFNSWELSVAGYNAGEGTIRRGIKKYDTNNFWKLAEHRFLPAETKLYVPKLIAAILIAKNPEKYGFENVQLEVPLDFEQTKVPRRTSLRAVAAALNEDFETIHNLNRELTKLITPPDQDYYEIKIPNGSKDLLADTLPRVHATVTTKFKTHKIKSGETLTQICRKYNLNKTTILKANDIHLSKMQVGKLLRIPYRETEYVLLSEEEMKGSDVATRDGTFILHKIQPGETIGKVASRYNISPYLIAAWNDLKDINKIGAGQQLALYISDETVRGINETLSGQEYLTKKQPEKETVRVFTGSSKRAISRTAADTLTYYKVLGGDSLWKIARQFNLQADDIAKWNNLKTNTIHPGLKLLLKI